MYMESDRMYYMPADSQDMFFCIVERNGSDLLWLFRGSLQQLLPISMVWRQHRDRPLTAMLRDMLQVEYSKR